MNKSLELESIQFNYSALESVSSGAAVTSVLPGLVKLMGTGRVFLVASKTLSQATGEFQALQDVSYTHLTLPTTSCVYISVVTVCLNHTHVSVKSCTAPVRHLNVC